MIMDLGTNIDINAILNVILGIVAVVLGAKWLKVKSFLKKVAEALVVTSEAIEDDKITQEEEQRMIEDWNEVIELAKDLVK